MLSVEGDPTIEETWAGLGPGTARAHVLVAQAELAADGRNHVLFGTIRLNGQGPERFNGREWVPEPDWDPTGGVFYEEALKVLRMRRNDGNGSNR